VSFKYSRLHVLPLVRPLAEICLRPFRLFDPSSGAYWLPPAVPRWRVMGSPRRFLDPSAADYRHLLHRAFFPLIPSWLVSLAPDGHLIPISESLLAAYSVVRRIAISIFTGRPFPATLLSNCLLYSCFRYSPYPAFGSALLPSFSPYSSNHFFSQSQPAPVPAFFDR